MPNATYDPVLLRAAADDIEEMLPKILAVLGRADVATAKVTWDEQVEEQPADSVRVMRAVNALRETLCGFDYVKSDDGVLQAAG